MSHIDKSSRFPYLLAVILLILLINSSRSIFDAYNSIGRLDQAKFQLEHLKIENARLQEDISYVRTPEYLQKAAVEELNMAKPGETILIVEQMQPKKPGEEGEKAEVSLTKPSPLELWATVFNLQGAYFSWQNKDF